MLVGMFYCVFYSYKNGNPRLAMAPYDYSSRFCGHTKGTEGFKKLYFTQLTNSTPSENIVGVLFDNAVCVKSCPKKALDPI